jgi:subtilase family serine protease
MMRNRFAVSTLASLLSVFAFNLPASAQNRLPQGIPASGARAVVANTVIPRAKAATDLGPAAGDKPLTNLSLRFNMTAAQSAALTQLLAAQQNPASPQYHQWLTRAQFGAEFGLSTADLATVSDWLQAQGFTITNVANSRTFIQFSGTVAQAEQAFGVTLHNVSLRGEQHISNLTDPSLPTAIANVVQGVTGLNDFRMKPHVLGKKVTAKLNGGSTYGNLVAPGDFYTIYDLKPLYSAATPINGAGIKVAVVGQVDVNTADVSAFRSAGGLSTTNLPTTTTYGAAPGAPTALECNSANPPDSCDDYYESSIDLEWSGATAPSASIIFATGVDVFENAMTGAIDNDIAPIVTTSYGNCETGFGAAYLAQFNALFQQANAQGQTVFSAAGDSGATDCDGGDGETFATQGLAVDFPGSSPFVTSVGGTMFNENGGTYWSTTDGANAGTALSYIPEQPWNEFFQGTALGIYGLGDGGGGGGASAFYAKPAWQVGTGVPNDYARDVPDVAFNAGANHDPYVVCSFGSCTNGYANSSGEYLAFGGTSVPTPSFAGILALLEQKVSPSKGLGNINPTIYGLANSSYASTVFHDVTTGNNAAPCEVGTGAVDCTPGLPNYYAPGTLLCPANSCSGDIAYSAIGYVAGVGYDEASGWGSMDINNMVSDWTLVTPTGTGTTSALAQSTTTVSTTTASVNAGASVALSATVASGSNTVTTTPTGTVTLVIDGVASGTSGTLSGGTATLTYSNTTSLVAGAHTFSVSYGGDSNYAGSIGSTQIDIVPANAGDFTITASPASVSVASGGLSSAITLTVASVNGFAGTVSFGIPNSGFSSSTFDEESIECISTTAAPNCAADSVNVTATAAGTAQLTIYAYYNSNTGLAKRGRLHAGSGGMAQMTLPPKPNPWMLGGSGVAVAGLILLGLPRRRNRWSAVLVALVTVGIFTVAGCTGSTASAGGGTTADQTNAPAGTSTFLVTATGVNSAGTSITNNVTVTVTVQ